ncbi:uncharacterized protein BDFB_004596 [Asbolus verrucosus]|uniref:Uncharacterized protein n=1 Tax=Asbolus verrucosus TaxID=1661398 RepID=A0A482VPH4_ASBVE|nr:uncharacterized protein BDFB_004596 [Asbolus verrucosus]
MDDLKPEEEFGPFEGSMFIGGAPSDYLDPKTSVHQGLIGCFRGLVVNEEILDIYSYMSVHLSEIIKDCKPSCVPNPCQNGAQCKELWSTFECICPNPWAYKGKYCETNINVNALTFTKPEGFLRRNYLSTEDEEDKNALKMIFEEQILINLRTYDELALIFYANDHLNNFVHLFICNGTQVVYLFNFGTEIYDVTVDYADLNSSKSVQIAIVRDENKTTVHVNDKNSSTPVGILLLDKYSNKPWINPEKEVLAPQRPPAPPTEYFQLNLGGYDSETLLKVAEDPPILPGYVGCMRGFQIGQTLIDLPSKVREVDEGNGHYNCSVICVIHNNMLGVKANCNMKCDALPCKHEGICIENFRNQEHSCDCEHTSYYGEFCSDEKGADFSGESILWREYLLNGSVDHVKIQLAFSSMDVRQKNTVLLLLQTENNRSFYLLVGLSPEGYLIFQEDREGAVFAAIVHTKSFINGARHSVYYKRDHNESELLVDREIIEMHQIPAQTFTNVPELGANEVQIGGHNTNDPRFAIYKGYSGCLSNIVIEVNEHVMKPLEEYMLFTKTGAEKVNVSNPHGVRSAQCSPHFDVLHEKTPGTTNLNISQGKDKTWVEDAPQRVLYVSNYLMKTEQEEGIDKIIVVVLSVFFVLIIICCIYELYRTDKQYKRRKEFETDANILWSKEQAAKMQETPFVQVPIEAAPKPPTQNGKLPNENTNSTPNSKDADLIVSAEIVPVLEEIPTKLLKRTDSKKKKRISFRDSTSELEWDTPEENSELLSSMQEEDEESEISEEELTHKPVSNIETMAPYSSISEVPLTSPNRARIRSPPPHSNPLATQLPYMIDEMGSLEFTGTSSPISKENHKLANDTDHEEKKLKETKSLENPFKFEGILKPVFLNDYQRTFGNPVSYLGGPKLAPRNRWSVESVLSLD